MVSKDVVGPIFPEELWPVLKSLSAFTAVTVIAVPLRLDCDGYKQKNARLGKRDQRS